jgi:hypothetical protein
VLDSKLLDGRTVKELLEAAEFGLRVKAADEFLLNDGVVTDHVNKFFANIHVFEMLVRALEEWKTHPTDPFMQQLIGFARNIHATSVHAFRFLTSDKIFHAYTHYLSGSARQVASAESGATAIRGQLSGASQVRVKSQTGTMRPTMDTNGAALKQELGPNVFLNRKVPLCQVLMILKGTEEGDMFCATADGTHVRGGPFWQSGFSHGDATGFDNDSLDQRGEFMLGVFDDWFEGGWRKRKVPEINLAAVDRTPEDLLKCLDILAAGARRELCEMKLELENMQEALTRKLRAKKCKDETVGLEEFMEERRVRCQEALQGAVSRAKVAIEAVEWFVNNTTAPSLQRLQRVSATAYALLDWRRIATTEVSPRSQLSRIRKVSYERGTPANMSEVPL